MGKLLSELFFRFIDSILMIDFITKNTYVFLGYDLMVLHIVEHLTGELFGVPEFNH